MIYWDSSVLVPLCVEEPDSASVIRRWNDADNNTTWCASRIEIMSALSRKLRERAFEMSALLSAQTRRDRLWTKLTVIDDFSEVARRAELLLLRHPLRAADAMQLGAALTAASDDPRDHAFFTFDTRLAEAAQLEGFELVHAR